MLVFPQKNNVVLAEGLEPTCDQLPFLQGISLRGYARMVLCIYSILHIFIIVAFDTSNILAILS